MKPRRIFNVRFKTSSRWSIEQISVLAQLRGGNCLSTEYVGAKHHLTWSCSSGHVWKASLFNVYTNKSWCPYRAGKARRTILDAQALASKRGGECLSTSIKNIDDRLQWKCAQGHIWDATFKRISQGAWCRKCYLESLRPSLSDAIELAEKRGGECLSRSVFRVTDVLEWRCSAQHTWRTKLDTVKQGHWCPTCANINMRCTLKDAVKLAESKGGKCLSKHMIDGKDTLTWECSHGHKWKSKFSNVRHGMWCPNCEHIAKRVTIDDAKALARMKNGQCLSITMESRQEFLKWKCSEGHIWETQYRHVKQGNWCPKCARIASRLTLEDAKNIAEKNGGDCLSHSYTSIKEPLTWLCSRGHTWKANLLNVRHKRTWCPVCRRPRNQKECHEIFSSLFPNHLFEEEGTSEFWKPMRVDGYCKEFKLVWEYHGVQHFKYVEFFHRSFERFQRQIDRDARLRNACTENGWLLIEIPYWIRDKHVFIVINLCQLGLFRLLPP